MTGNKKYKRIFASYLSGNRLECVFNIFFGVTTTALSL